MNYKFEFTEQETNLILQSLGELPAKISHNMINKIKSDIINQGAASQIKEDTGVDIEKKADIKAVK